MQIPNAISTADLQTALDAAKASNTPMFDGLDEDGVVSLVSEKLNEICQACSNPMSGKITALMVIANFIHMHQAAAQDAMEVGEIDAMAQILEDVAQLKIAHQAITSVRCSVDDFTLGDDAIAFNA